MPLDRKEVVTRDFIEAIYQTLEPESVDQIDVIRGAALAMFSKALEAKLRNLQYGETVQLTFRIDIVTADGRVRPGEDEERGMPQYAEWRTAVFTRDAFTCRDCGTKGGELQAHHVKAWRSHPEARFDVDNGVTLCGPCHVKHHPHLRARRRYGTA